MFTFIAHDSRDAVDWVAINRIARRYAGANWESRMFRSAVMQGDVNEFVLSLPIGGGQMQILATNGFYSHGANGIITMGMPHTKITFMEVSFQVLICDEFTADRTDEMCNRLQACFNLNGSTLLPMLRNTAFDAMVDGAVTVRMGRHALTDGSVLDIIIRTHQAYIQFHDDWIRSVGDGYVGFEIVRRMA